MKKQVKKLFWNESVAIISDHSFCFALTVLLCDWLSNIFKLDNIINCNYIENLSGWLRIISFYVTFLSPSLIQNIILRQKQIDLSCYELLVININFKYLWIYIVLLLVNEMNVLLIT